jgi:hypothetical protein
LSLSHRSALQVSLVQRQDRGVTLRDVEAERDLPGKAVVAALSEAHVEAPFSVSETGQIPADSRGDALCIEHWLEPFLLIARPPRIFTATLFGDRFIT